MRAPQVHRPRRHRAGECPSREHPLEGHPAEGRPAEGRPAGRHPAGRHSAGRHSSGRRPAGRRLAHLPGAWQRPVAGRPVQVTARRSRLPGWARLAAPILAASLAATAAAPGWVPYRLQWGDTLWGLARSHHTTVAAIRAANHLSGDLIRSGALLLLPGTGGSGAAAAPVSAVPGRTYLVRAGDTLTAVAARFHTTLGALARANHLPASLQIDIGQRLVVPGAPDAAAAPAAAPAPAPAPAHSRPAVAALIRATAVANGVDPDLALAVAWQESGFQQRVRSGTGAIGVMQLEPATDQWLSFLLGRPLDPYRLADNVLAGVHLLHLLLVAAPVPVALAGYYQGLGSVLAHGMSPDTRRYVADVLALRARFR